MPIISTRFIAIHIKINVLFNEQVSLLRQLDTEAQLKYWYILGRWTMFCVRIESILNAKQH